MAPIPFERFMSVRRFSPTLALSPDGDTVFFASNISGQFNLWSVPVAGGWPSQLTSYTDQTVRVVAARPHDSLLAFTADADGDEFGQLYLVDPGGWPEQLTDEPEVQHHITADAFSPDGRRLAYAANARKPTDMEIWVRELSGGEPRAVFGEGKYTFPGAWSPDGSHLLAVDFRSNLDFSIHLVDVANATAELLTSHEEPARFEPGPWAADGSGFYLLTDAGAENMGLAFFTLATREWSWVAPSDFDVTDVAASADGRVLAWIENDRGWAKLRARDVVAGTDLPAPTLPDGTTFAHGAALTVSADGGQIALIWESPRRSPDVWVVDTATGDARAVTESRVAAPGPDELVEPELVSFPTWDGRNVPAWLYRAPGDGARPAVLYIHGGPEAQERPKYFPFAQYLCSRGISVLAPNIRGSSGYGKTYQRLLYRDWGRGDLRDFDAAAKWLASQEWVDGTRLGVAGGSYGGFATLSCVSRLPEHWAAAVDIFGPSNLVTFVRAVPPGWRRLMRDWVGDPDEDHEMLVENSPLTYAEAIRAPLLVIQGAKDPRVVLAESDQLVERLRELGREVEYEVFEDEGHGFTRHANDVKAWRMTAEFLERHLS